MPGAGLTRPFWRASEGQWSPEERAGHRHICVDHMYKYAVVDIKPTYNH